MKQVPQDLIDYLLTMISPPPHIENVQIPVVLGVAGHDFTQYADGSLHGLIARGTPTEAQSAEINRALKPGAHVCLMTDEDDLTGHVGTCNLEDSGLEIRDSLIVLEEGIPFFYGAKAATRERNAGCHDLAAEPQFGLKPEYVQVDEGDTTDDTDELEEALLHHLSPELVSYLFDGGTIDKSKVPTDYRAYFVEKKASGRGNLHPTVKPVDVLEWLLKDLPEGTKTVLDPFMGSGSMGIAAVKTGHDYVGVEMDDHYIKIADARIRHWAAEENGWVQKDIVSEAARETAEPKEMSLDDLFGL